ncbi:MAG: HD domain-containing protein [Dehalococcoidia bacterium]
MRSFATVDEAWESLLAQRSLTDGESLDLVEHAFQTAEGLERAGCDDELIAAGVLHDLGDGRVAPEAHASWASNLVRPLFGERVAWLINAHADAKRYLCASDAAYWDGLSPTSQRTMIEQGGLMTEAEVTEFAAHRWATDALLLRRCDDGGKDSTYRVANSERFRACLERVASAVAC